MEPGRKSGIGKGHGGRLDQEPGSVGALGARECDRGRANLLGEQSPKMAFAEAQSLGGPGDAFAVDGAVRDQAHGARDSVGAPVPIGEPGAASGRQRLQARKPADCAAAAVG